MKSSLLLVLALSVLPLSPAFASEPVINVSGSAEVRVAPDEIFIDAGVETRDTNLDVATRQNNERMAGALAFLKQAGVPDKHVQTDFIQVQPDYGPGDNLIEPRFYRVRKSLEIKLVTVTNLETILTGLLDHGVNNLNSLEFRTTQLRKYRDQARAMAINAAKEKADALLKELGAKRGKPQNITANEYGGWWRWPGGGWGWRNNRMGMYQNVSQNAGGAPEVAGNALSAGQISITATVNVSFRIK